MRRFLNFVDAFVPSAAKKSQSDYGRARVFVATHFIGPFLAFPIVPVLMKADPNFLLPSCVILTCILLFMGLPCVLRRTGNLECVARCSFFLLMFVTLFGSLFYGGFSSPFAPWLLVALLIGFFYLEKEPWRVVVGFVSSVAVFTTIHTTAHLDSRTLHYDLRLVGLFSVASATIYVAWMGIYYGQLLTTEAEAEAELARCVEIAKRLQNLRDAAEASDQETSRFLAKMSHELRTPLNAVIGYSEMLLEDMDDISLPTRRADLQRIASSGRHLLSLVADVLDLREIEARGAISIDLSEIDVAALVANCVDNIQALASKQNNRISIHLASRLGVIVSDPRRLRQILINLIGNAAKFTHDGEIRVHARRVLIADQDWVEMIVSDTGCGMDPLEAERLFKDFSQVGAQARQGTGLGLSVSQALAGALGGTIYCKTSPGNGSTFTLQVPATLENLSLAA